MKTHAKGYKGEETKTKEERKRGKEIKDGIGRERIKCRRVRDVWRGEVKTEDTILRVRDRTMGLVRGERERGRIY